MNQLVVVINQLRTWTRRHVIVAAGAAVVVALAVGLPTDVIPNPVFGRPVPVTWWSYPVLAATAVLGGMIVATYVRVVDGEPLTLDERSDPVATKAQERHAQTGGLAGLLSVFAVGCPVCNHLVVLALGVTGARQWFEPFQPFLAVGSLALLGYALWMRLRFAETCPLPAQREVATQESQPTRR